MLFKFIFKKKQKKNQEKFKFDINKWMNLTKEERLEIDSKEKNESMRKKKVFLKVKLIKKLEKQYLFLI